MRFFLFSFFFYYFFIFISFFLERALDDMDFNPVLEWRVLEWGWEWEGRGGEGRGEEL